MRGKRIRLPQLPPMRTCLKLLYRLDCFFIFLSLFEGADLVLGGRFKPDMWSKIAEEMAIPWRAAEAMHWQLGEQEMARRAGVVPFSLSNVNPETPPKSRRSSGSSTKSKKEAASRQQGQLPSVAEITSAQGLTYPIPDARPSLSQSSTELEGENPPETLNPKASGD